MNPWEDLTPASSAGSVPASGALFTRRKKVINSEQKRIQLEAGPCVSKGMAAGPFPTSSKTLDVIDAVLSGLESGSFKGRNDVMDLAIIDWRLEGEKGPIDRPRTVEALDNLPGAIRGGLYNFLCNYRGDLENPTTRS